MFKVSKIASILMAVAGLSACSGSLNDTFFQADGTTAGNICIEGMSVSAKSIEAQVVVNRLRQYYGGTPSTVINVYSAQGYQATCILYANKPKADVIIDEAYYLNTIVPATNG